MLANIIDPPEPPGDWASFGSAGSRAISIEKYAIRGDLWPAGSIAWSRPSDDGRSGVAGREAGVMSFYSAD